MAPTSLRRQRGIEIAIWFRRKLTLLRDSTFELAQNYALILQAWAFFANHYHLVMSFENIATAHRDFVKHLHREPAIRLNSLNVTPGRRVMYEFWDTHLTFEKSWLARLNYLHQNLVKHGLVSVANQYPWCSASWFETNARFGFVKSVYSFKVDRTNMPDDFVSRPVLRLRGRSKKATRGRVRTPKAVAKQN
jgi:putative transposase